VRVHKKKVRDTFYLEGNEPHNLFDVYKRIYTKVEKSLNLFGRERHILE
jgi:hypothetical protein